MQARKFIKKVEGMKAEEQSLEFNKQFKTEMQDKLTARMPKEGGMSHRTMHVIVEELRAWTTVVEQVGHVRIDYKYTCWVLASLPGLCRVAR